MKRKYWSLITVFILPALALGLAMSFVTPARAINYTVTVDCAPIQACIDLAGSGDTVIVPAGIYTESLTLSSPVSLTGASSATTIIRALTGQRVLTVTGAAIDNSVVISGLTFSGGDVSGGNICFSGDPTNCGGGILLTNGAQPALQNVIIENSSAFRGGGLYANETGGLVLDHVIVRDNSAILAGGGLNARNMPVTVTHSLFQQNTSTNNVGGALVTGADFGVVAPVLISNTTFISNAALCPSLFGICDGGAVSTFDQEVTVVNSLFENNRCNNLVEDDCDGGGLRLTRSFNASQLTLINTDFISNTADGNGGGVHASVTTTVIAGRFERNAAGGRQTAFSDGGGGMRVRTLFLTGTEFISNTSGEDGGAILVDTNAVIRDARLTANRAVTNGAGLYVAFSLAPVLISNTTFTSNTAGMNGGGAYVSLGDARVTGGRFERNRASGPENDGGLLTTQNGGGGLWVGRDLTVRDTEFISNVAETNGGGAHVRGQATLSGGQFVQNQSLGDFLAIQGYGGGGLVVAGPLSLTGTTFTGNQAAIGGGGILALGPAVLSGGLLQDNTAIASSGGGIWTSGNLTVTGTQFAGNVSGAAGGGAASGDTAFVTSGFFSDNQALFGGGLRALTVTVTSTQFISNFALSQGGGLDAFERVDVTNSLFQGNVSDGTGGGVNAFLNPVRVTGSQFLSNTAANNGGGLNAVIGVIITNSLIKHNRAVIGNGGGVTTGGAVTLGENSEISHNTAGADGGGIWANSGLNGTNGRFENNTSGGSGGGYYGGLANLNVQGTVFANNQAVGDGGGAYAFNGEAVGQALFEGNIAAGAGGGLFLQRFVHVTATQFLGNAADLGGGLAISRTTSGTLGQFIHNSLFARNTATTSGAGIYWNQPRPIDLIHNTIASPTLSGGSALYIVTGTVQITNSIIASHTTGIEVAGGTVTQNHNLFSGNFANTSGPVGGGAGSLSGAPGFLDPANDDYHLTSASQAIDLGIDAGVNLDFEDDPRPGFGGFDAGFDENVFEPVLSVSKAAVPATDALYRGAISYTITLTNSGGATAAGVLLTDTLPAGVVFDRWLAQNGANESGGQLTWNGTVAANDAITVSFVVSHTGDYGDVLTNTVEFNHAASASTGTAEAVVAVEPELELVSVYLPLVMKNYSPPLPDLIVESLLASTNAVTVVIKNVGAAPVVDAFGVDLYLNPYSPPTGASQRWYDVANQGIVWEVDGVVIQPGDTLTLILGDSYYSDPASHFSLPLPAGTPIDAQVDPGGSAGRVLESHELVGGVYNNITGTTVLP